MKWFEGGIAEAVATSKQRGAIFVVYIEGKEDNAKYLNEAIESKDVTDTLSSEHFVAIKIEGGTVPFTQFSMIYKQASIPSLFFIGKTGLPVEIIKDRLDSSQLLEKVNTILEKHVPNFVASNVSNASATTSEVKHTESVPIATEQNVECVNGVCTIKSTESVQKPDGTNIEENIDTASTSESSILNEEKIERAKKLIEIQQAQKRKEEEDKEKQREIERRKEGKNLQQYKQWQQEQELKNLKEEREKLKKEETEARQRILAQIAQDKADRAARFNQQSLGSTSATANQANVAKSIPVVASNNARLQFRLPDGSSNTHDFQSSQTLQEVRQYVIMNLNVPFRSFTLSTTFPRREFSAEDNNRTLLDLELCPNAVMLILPVNQGIVAAGSPGGFTAFLWSFIAPLLGIMTSLKNWFMGRGANQPSTPTTGEDPTNSMHERKRGSPTSSNTGPSSAKRRIPESTVVRRQGNIHRLSDKTDSDDENNTWNGNSTQQM